MEKKHMVNITAWAVFKYNLVALSPPTLPYGCHWLFPECSHLPQPAGLVIRRFLDRAAEFASDPMGLTEFTAMYFYDRLTSL